MEHSQHSCKKFFVYGTLRACIKSDWFDRVHNNEAFKLTYYNAKLFGAKLYYMPDLGYPTIKITNNREDFVVGNIVESSDFNEVREVFDDIEEYPFEYGKQVTRNCMNLDCNEYQAVWVYYFNDPVFLKNDDIDEEKYQLIEDGDLESIKNYLD